MLELATPTRLDRALFAFFHFLSWLEIVIARLMTFAIFLYGIYGLLHKFFPY